MPDLNKVFEIPDEKESEDNAKKVLKELEAKLKLKKSLERNKKSGKVNIRKVIKEIGKTGQIINTSLFMEERKNDNKHDVIVLIDYSGSMSCKVSSNRLIPRLSEAKGSVYSLGLVLNGLNVNFGVYGFCTENGSGKETLLLEIKSFKKEFNKAKFKKTLINTNFQNGAVENNDAIALIGGAELLKKNGNTNNKKLLIIISDGEPCAPCSFLSRGGSDLNQATKEAIEEINKSGIKTLALSLSQEANGFIEEAGYTQKVFLNEETIKKGDFNKKLITAYLKAVEV